MTITQKTRRESLAKTLEILGERQRMVLQAVKEDPGATAWDVANDLNLPVYVVRPRLTELKALGLVSAIGKAWCDATARQTAIWALTDKTWDPNGQGKLL